MDAHDPWREGRPVADRSAFGGFAADWSDPAANPTEAAWLTPEERRRRERVTLRRTHLGFVGVSAALLVASLSTVVGMLLLFSGRGQIGGFFGISHWDFIEESFVVWTSFLGVCLLWGRQPDDPTWQRRSGLLLMMCLVDVVLWSLDHGQLLGLSEAKFGHEWFRRILGQALGWSEFLLIASMAADTAARFGQPQAVEFGKAARSMVTSGSLVWLMYFYQRTSWDLPVWPLRERPMDKGTIMLWLGMVFLNTICLIQTTTLCLLAAQASSRAAASLPPAEEAVDPLLVSRSEGGWDDPFASRKP
jgi:hypothetical protein